MLIFAFQPWTIQVAFEGFVSRFFFARNRLQQRLIEKKEELEQLKRQLYLARQECQSLREQLALCHFQQLQVITPSPLWQSQKPLPGHQYNPIVIALCCQLCVLVGFRATTSVLQCISDALGLDLPIPSHDAVRNWNCRNGVAILQEPVKADDWIWLIDHSVQLGKMFVLVVLGIRQSNLPQGCALTRQDMSVLAVMPTQSRNKEEVGRQLQTVSNQFGTPMTVVCDGACELREGVASLEEGCFKGICLSDVKHKIANLLKKELGPQKRWKEFELQLGTTTAAIQQTELEHWLPPRKKQKCRFMNFHSLVDWAVSVENELTMRSPSLRLIEKLGWLSQFTEDLKEWQQVRGMIGVVLRQANEQGVWIGASEQLRAELMAIPGQSDWCQQMRERLIEIVASNESLLKQLGIDDLRLPCSTEVLESGFGAFKSLQRHHNRGTFTTLLATFATLFDKCTPEKIRERLTRVSNRDLKSWLESHGLTNSTQSRRVSARSKNQ